MRQILKAALPSVSSYSSFARPLPVADGRSYALFIAYLGMQSIIPSGQLASFHAFRL